MNRAKASDSSGAGADRVGRPRTSAGLRPACPSLKAARTAEGLFADNIYFDISAIVVIVADSPVEDEFVWTIRNVGIDHVLLGSDYPQYSLEQNVSALERLSLNESEKAKIRFDNAQRLFHVTNASR